MGPSATIAVTVLDDGAVAVEATLGHGPDEQVIAASVVATDEQENDGG